MTTSSQKFTCAVDVRNEWPLRETVPGKGAFVLLLSPPRGNRLRKPLMDISAHRGGVATQRNLQHEQARTLQDATNSAAFGASTLADTAVY